MVFQTGQTALLQWRLLFKVVLFSGNMEVLSFFSDFKNLNSQITTTRTHFLSVWRGLAAVRLVWKKLFGQLSLIFLVNWEDWLPSRICVDWNSNCKLIRTSAQFFFSFKRICSILSCVNEAVGANVANFLGELGRLASWSNSWLLEPQLRAHWKECSGFI